MENPLTGKQLTHIEADGRAAMVDVSGKAATVRAAMAGGQVRMLPETLEAILAGNNPKGSAIETARLAGIMAAKQTSHLIPLCHPLPLGKIAVEIQADRQLPGLKIEATVKTTAPTGVEMEALTAVAVAALTLYDMAKAIEKTMQIENIRLLRKSGGKSGDFVAEDGGRGPGLS